MRKMVKYVLGYVLRDFRRICFEDLVYMFSNYVLKFFKRVCFGDLGDMFSNYVLRFSKKYVLRIQRVCFQSMY